MSMITVIGLHPPFEQKTRNIVTLKEAFDMSGTQAQTLYERIFSQQFPQDFADDFIEKLKVYGWRVHVTTDDLCEKERLQIEAKQWYDGLSQRQKEYVAFFQRMMIPTSF